MKVLMGDPPTRYSVGVQVGDVYPAKGGRGDTRFWLVVSLGHSGQSAHMLGLNADGVIVSTASYNSGALEERQRIGWCADVRGYCPRIEWETDGAAP